MADDQITEAQKADREDANQAMQNGDQPVAKSYPDGAEAELPASRDKPAETIVEHPLAPTDTNPDPQGLNPDNGFTPVATADGVSEPQEGPIRITSLTDGLHLGDGRVLNSGDSAGVTKDVAKILTGNKQAKRG